MKYGFTGTQRGMSPRQYAAILRILSSGTGEFHEGDCIGSDAESACIAWDVGSWFIVQHPPTNQSKRAFAQYDEAREPKPYLERNHDIVDDCDELLATPGEKEEQLRSGTWATIRYAKKCGKPVTVIYPDGTIDVFNKQARAELPAH